MGNSKQNNKSKEIEESKTIELDAEISVPSITALLNRKKIGKTNTSSSTSKTNQSNPPPSNTATNPTGLSPSQKSITPPPVPKEAKTGSRSVSGKPPTESILVPVKGDNPSQPMNQNRTLSGAISIDEPSKSLEIQITEFSTGEKQPQQNAFRYSKKNRDQFQVGASTQTQLVATQTSSQATSTQPSPPSVSTQKTAGELWEAKPAIKKSNKQKPKNKLISWSLKTIKKSNDPLGKALAVLAKKGMTDALYLGITPPPQGSKLPHFYSKAAYGSDQRLKLWADFHWDPTMAPNLWRVFLKEGIRDFSQLKTESTTDKESLFLRKILGADKDEHLIILRVGSRSRCRGMLAIFGKKDLSGSIQKVIEIIQAEPVKKKVA